MLFAAPTTFPTFKGPAGGSSPPARTSSKAPARRAAPKRKARAKPPCKYGPRDALGYCPPKPSAPKSPLTSAAASTSRRSSSTSSKAGLGGRLASVAVKEATGKAVTAILPKRLSRRAAAAQTRATTTAARQAVGKALTRAGVAAGKAKVLAKKVAPSVAKATIIGAVGAGAYAVTRKTKAGGALGDYVVKKHYEARERKEAAAMARFQAALKAERARGPVSSARVKQLAKQSGLG